MVQAAQRHCCTIAERLAERSEYDDEDLVAFWLGKDGYPELSVRAICERVNQRILKQVYSEHDRPYTQCHLEEEEKLLRDTKSTEDLDRGNLCDELRAHGIDPDRVADDLLSSSTLHRHLTECLGASKSREANPEDWAPKKLDYARDVARQNATDALSALDEAGTIDAPDQLEVSVAIIVSCPTCGREIKLNRLLHRGYLCKDCHTPSTA